MQRSGNRDGRIQQYRRVYREHLMANGYSVVAQYAGDRTRLVIAGEARLEWLPDQGSNLGPAD